MAATVFGAIADPWRREILARLSASVRLSITALSHPLPMTRQAVTKHLKILATAGLVGVQVQGRERIYEANLKPLKDLDDWLAPFRQAWDERLERLEKHLEETP